MPTSVSIVIPVFNGLSFTRQCLDRIWRNTGDQIEYDVIVVDNGSSDATPEWFAAQPALPRPLSYHRNVENLGFARANNLGATLSRAEHLLFLNNDTLVLEGWLSEMLRVMQSDPAIGVVGIKQLFPYTNTIYHTGIVFAAGGRPLHVYPHLDADLPCVNHEREYQAVTGACLLIPRKLFHECGGFDEEYLNGYEDVDLCLKVRQQRRRIVCCTSAYIYHYGQMSEGRTRDDDRNAVLFAKRWGQQVRIDQDDILLADRMQGERTSRPSVEAANRLPDDGIYFADDLGQGSALTWINAELALALKRRGVPVFIKGGALSPTVPGKTRKLLAPLAISGVPIGGMQIKWSHYWAQHLHLDLAGDFNCEFFVVNYLLGRPHSAPSDYWLQCLRQNHHIKLPLSQFCESTLAQVGIPDSECHVISPGYSPEIDEIESQVRHVSRFRFLTVTNSHDLARYGTQTVVEAYSDAFEPSDAVTLVVKDYGASSGDTTIREYLHGRSGGPHIEYVGAFTEKQDLIRLYKSCGAFVSGHRGEGFGMKILDAMACGLPVITPLFGGNTDYCTEENCFPVEFTVVPMGDCFDSRSLEIPNQPMWAEPAAQSLAGQMRRVYEGQDAAAAIGAKAQAYVKSRFSWDEAANRLVAIRDTVHASRSRPPRSARAASASAERSPYWLGLRVSVVIPTFNRVDKLLKTLDALTRQSVLPSEFEVIVVDDGSSDGTAAALSDRRYPFQTRHFRQENAGPGAARNRGIAEAAGELVLFIGDDILAGERLLEEHLLAHATRPEHFKAVLGHIDWSEEMPTNAVMEFVCGEAMLQFAYGLIPQLPKLDHRFFYSSNVSLKRQFLLDAADAGIGFDPCFRHAAFEDSEFAFRLAQRGLEIVYAPRARAFHDHWMDLPSFATREFRAGQMAVVFYRKHPGHDEQLRVRWIADLVKPAAALAERPELLKRLEAVDRETDGLLAALAGSLQELIAMKSEIASGALPAGTLRATLHNVLHVIFDVHRTRGKVLEWYAGVDDEAARVAAQVLASVRRKFEYLNFTSDPIGQLRGTLGLFDGGVVPGLGGRDEASETGGAPAAPSLRSRAGQRLRHLVGSPRMRSRLITVDRYVQSRLGASKSSALLNGYLNVRRRLRHIVAGPL